MKEKKGIRIVTIFVPAAVAILLLYVLIVICTYFINTASTKTINVLNRTSESITDISDLQSRNNKLYQTSYSFINKPYLETENVVNVVPLKEYVRELETSRSSNEILENIQNQDLSDEIKDSIKKNVNISIELFDTQRHALYLIKAAFEADGSVVKTTDSYAEYLECMKKIEVFNLPADEQPIPYQGKYGTAIRLFAAEYNQKNGNLSSNLRADSIAITEHANQAQKSLTNQIKTFRIILWVSLALILLANFICLFIIVFMLVVPIVRFAKKIDDNERLDEHVGLYESKRLATAYNALLDRHNEFENELREVAEEDALTGLPNRYSYNKFLSTPIQDEKRVCIFVFDVNNLKYVNDNFGHNKGDELIKKASECITQCFVIDDHTINCYRIGGDEFVAVLINLYEEDIPALITKFKTMQTVKNVSIAVGYSYSNDVKEIGYEKLFIEADQKMYDNKKEMKQNETTN